MSELPIWWIVVSGIFFGLAILVLIGLLFAVLKAMQALKSVQASVEKTIDRAEKVVDRLEAVAKSAQGTVESIGGRAKSAASSIESVVSAGAKKMETVAPIFVMALAGLKLYQHFAEMRAERQHDESEHGA